MHTSHGSIPPSNFPKQDNFLCAVVPTVEYTIEADAQTVHSAQNPDNWIYMAMPDDNINECDVDNQLMVTAYVPHIYNHLNLVEDDFMVDSEYMDIANEMEGTLPVRIQILKLLVSVVTYKTPANLTDVTYVGSHGVFKLGSVTLHTAVGLTGRYLSVKTVRECALLLVGVACLLVRRLVKTTIKRN